MDSRCIVMDSYTKKEIENAQENIRDRVRSNSNLVEFPNMGNCLNPFKRIREDYIFPSYDATEEYLDNISNKWGRKYSPVVAFHSGKAKIPNNIKKLEERAENETKKYLKYKETHSVKKFKAKYIGCEKCGSKVNKDYIKYELCPVCNNDLRSKTTRMILNQYLDKKNALIKEFQEKTNTLKGKGPIKYLVMYEEYIG